VVLQPVGIDTGKLIKELRWQQNNRLANRVADTIAVNMAGMTPWLRRLVTDPSLHRKEW
jgi:D-lactate dehydrogenase